MTETVAVPVPTLSRARSLLLGVQVVALAAASLVLVRDIPPRVGSVSAFPVPGSGFAQPGTELSFRGVAPGSVGAVTVTGTVSGRHAGRVLPHADGRGASFVPDAPFSPGEQVRVQTGLDLRRTGGGGDYTLRVAIPATDASPVVSAPTELGPRRRAAYRSRPDLTPPLVAVTLSGPGASPGLLALAPTKRGQEGPLLVDARGETVWHRPLADRTAHLLRVQRWRGEPVLTWWEGRSVSGHGQGEFVIADASYAEIARFPAGPGLPGDFHEFVLTDRGTALVTVYPTVAANLSSVGGVGAAPVIDGMAREIEVATGRVLFEWHSLDEVPIARTYARVPPAPGDALDYFHINSIAPDGPDHLLIGARATHAVYRVDTRTGEVAWTLGGKASDYALGAGADLHSQHDAQRLPDGTLLIFDNGAGVGGDQHRQSRSLQLALDDRAWVATVVRSMTGGVRYVSTSQGNAQPLPDGGRLLGWGSAGAATEFGPDGVERRRLRLPPDVQSYRTYVDPWVGRPTEPPAVAVTRTASGLRVAASWNGATEVARWVVRAGASAGGLTERGTALRTGFETTVDIATPRAGAAGLLVVVQAIDAGGRVLGTSAPVRA